MSARLPNQTAAALLAVALAVLAALMLQSPEDGIAAEAVPVEASLESCGNGKAPTCEIAVFFEPPADAVAYEATVTAPDGSALLTAPAAPGSATLSVPYVGDGTYVVRVTAFG